MRRLTLAALVVAILGVLAGTALAAGGASTIYNSTEPNGPRTNQASYGPEAYAFKTLGDQVNFAGTARSLSSVTVTLSSWACQQGSWNGGDCLTATGATFSQEITLTIRKVDTNEVVASKTQTFDVPYRPSASPKCDGGKWYTPSKECKNGLATDVTFNFSNEKLPDSVVYEISYNTSHYGPNPTKAAGPYDSLNIAVAPSVGTNSQPSVGTNPDSTLLVDGLAAPDFGNYTPAVQFKAGNAS
jgi:hypothetical protein